MPYETTTVPVLKSQDEIRRMLKKAGAIRIGVWDDQTDDGTPLSILEFEREHCLVRLRVPHRVLDSDEARERAKRAKRAVAEIATNHPEQEERRVWRILLYQIKTRMEAISEGIETFEQSFLPHIVDPVTNTTVWEHAEPAVLAGALRIGGRGLLALPAGAR